MREKRQPVQWPILGGQDGGTAQEKGRHESGDAPQAGNVMRGAGEEGQHVAGDGEGEDNSQQRSCEHMKAASHCAG